MNAASDWALWPLAPKRVSAFQSSARGRTGYWPFDAAARRRPSHTTSAGVKA